MSRMFEFITRTWNPCVGCPYKCCYCWASNFALGRLRFTSFEPRFFKSRLKKRFKPTDFVFISDFGDMFCPEITDEEILQVFDIVRGNPMTNFLTSTKNPERYVELLARYGDLPTNIVYGTTVESDINFPQISKAPSQSDRLFWMQKFAEEPLRSRYKRFISIEPILHFTDVNSFGISIYLTRPWAVAIGYDNYKHHLDEPSLDQTNDLINMLERNGIKVYKKTLRKAWWGKR